MCGPSRRGRSAAARNPPRSVCGAQERATPRRVWNRSRVRAPRRPGAGGGGGALIPGCSSTWRLRAYVSSGRLGADDVCDVYAGSLCGCVSQGTSVNSTKKSMRQKVGNTGKMYRNRNNHLKVELWVVSESVCVGLRKLPKGTSTKTNTPFGTRHRWSEERTRKTSAAGSPPAPRLHSPELGWVYICKRERR